MADNMKPQRTWLDRRGSSRKVPMEVLSLGFSRTGTLSMRIALKQLGYNECYHHWAWFENPPDSIMWQAAFDAKWNGKGEFGRAEFDQLLGHCRAVCDAPCTFFAEELIAAYPEAKVVLVERDVDEWWRSFKPTVFAALCDTHLLWLAPVDRFMRMYWPVIYYLQSAFLRGAVQMQDSAAQEAICKKVYRDHYALVKRLVPKERLLVMRMEEGWKPLCQFLGEKVPDTAFPNVNEGKMFVVQWTGLKRVLYVKALWAAGLVVGAVGAAIAAWWWAKR